MNRFDIPQSVVFLLSQAQAFLKLDALDVYALAAKHGNDWRELAGELCEIAFAARHDSPAKHASIVMAAEEVWKQFPRKEG